MHALAIMLLLVFLPLLGGCLGLVPIDHHASESGPRGCSRDDAEKMIENGRTTKSQLAEKLGPGVELARGKLWLYTFQDYHDQRVFWWLVNLYGGYGGGTGSIESCTDYYLLLEFDETGTVTRHRLRREGRLNALASNWDNVFR